MICNIIFQTSTSIFASSATQSPHKDHFSSLIRPRKPTFCERLSTQHLNHFPCSQLAESRRLLAVTKSKEKNYEVTIGELRLKLQEYNTKVDQLKQSLQDVQNKNVTLKEENKVITLNFYFIGMSLLLILWEIVYSYLSVNEECGVRSPLDLGNYLIILLF